jgi:DNA-binding NtrC family response regulator
MKLPALMSEEDGVGSLATFPGGPGAMEAHLEARSTRLADGAGPGQLAAWTAHDPVTREFLRRLREAAEQDVPVYLFGEPGSGRRCAALTLRRWREEWVDEGRPGRRDDALPVPILRVPSLRERPRDLPEIAARFLAALARDRGGPAHGLAPGTLEALLARPWRGNITELHAVLERAAMRAGDRQVLEADDLPRGAEPPPRPSQQAKNAAQRACLLRQLRQGRTVCGAAKLEGCTRANYIRLMRRLGILRADCVREP